MIRMELGSAICVVLPNVLFEALKARVNLNLARLDVVQLAVLENIRWSARVAR